MIEYTSCHRQEGQNKVDPYMDKGHDGQPHLKWQIRQRTKVTFTIETLNAIDMGLETKRNCSSKSHEPQRNKAEKKLKELCT